MGRMRVLALGAVGAGLAAWALADRQIGQREVLTPIEAYPGGETVELAGLPFRYLERGPRDRAAGESVSRGPRNGTASASVSRGSGDGADGESVSRGSGGGADGEPIVLVHGFGSSSDAFARVMPLLDPNRRVLALDLLGHGGSPRVAAPVYAPREHARYVRLFLDRFDIDRAVVIGSSFGGAVAIALAAGYPDRVSRLIVADSGVYMGDEVAGWLARLVAAPAIGRPIGRMLANSFLISPRLFERFYRRAYSPHSDRIDPDVLDRALANRDVRGTVDAMAAMMRSALPLQIKGDLRRVRAPALVIWGANDPMFPVSQGVKLAEELPNARLVVVPGVGHFPAEQAPDLFARAVSDFLVGQRAEAPRPASA